MLSESKRSVQITDWDVPDLAQKLKMQAVIMDDESSGTINRPCKKVKFFPVHNQLSTTP
jgi:hypothetical protein